MLTVDAFPDPVRACPEFLGGTPMRDETVDADALLWEAMADGDRTSLARLYDRHAPALLALGVRMLGTPAEAEDLVHDVLLDAWQRPEAFDPARGSVRTFLAMRTRSRALDRLRSTARTRLHVRDAGAPAAEPFAPDDPAMVPDQRRVQAALAALPEPQRVVLALAYFEGLSAAEIALHLTIPVGTVKSRTAAGFARLRLHLGVGPEGHPAADETGEPR